MERNELINNTSKVHCALVGTFFSNKKVYDKRKKQCARQYTNQLLPSEDLDQATEKKYDCGMMPFLWYLLIDPRF